LGENSRIDHGVTVGSDVVMGPDVVIMTISHQFRSPEEPVRLQGAQERRPVRVGDAVWIGTRVIILPVVTIGDGAVLGAGCVVTRDVSPYSIVAGVPAKPIGSRR
jgi:maltose O-acetyltransferase